jgi:hypothetical protein
MKVALIIAIVLTSLQIVHNLSGKNKVLDFLSIYYLVLFALCLKAF